MQRFLLTDGQGGYASLTRDFTVDRCDAGVFVPALRAPDLRINMVSGMTERLSTGAQFVLQHFSPEPVPCWIYQAGAVIVQRQLALSGRENACALSYRVENTGDESVTFTATPVFKLAPKEEALEQEKPVRAYPDMVTDGTYTLYIYASAPGSTYPARWQMQTYPEDEKDGRAGTGLAFTCNDYTVTLQPGQTCYLELVFALEPGRYSARDIIDLQTEHRKTLLARCPFRDPIARHLYMAADAFIVNRTSTGGKTIIAGYPLFSDWGRDTMIALPGCTLSTGRYDDAKSILRTFFRYEQDGLIPNLFPEGGNAPRYNTVDAALLLIDCVWQYYLRTKDLAFVAEVLPKMEKILGCYQRGTHHGIRMDRDFLIRAGQGMDQVTWMDVCVDGILPTPRHGKPVEINAYWYNALMIVAQFCRLLHCSGDHWEKLAELAKKSFLEQFWMEDKGYLKDVISGTGADMQLRCNQIWAASMSFTMLSLEQIRKVVETVEKHLLTDRGLRTLSPEDPQYHGFYGGKQFDRDMAYHQGTAWVFPMGAWCRAYLKAHLSTPKAANDLLQKLSSMEDMLTEGCIGQLPEIYDGDHPYEGKGCYAQAWSVGEILRAYEEIEKLLR